MKRFVLVAFAGLLAGTAALAQTRPAGVDTAAIDRGVGPGDALYLAPGKRVHAW